MHASDDEESGALVNREFVMITLPNVIVQRLVVVGLSPSPRTGQGSST
jgi:hypothetical protein